MPPGPKPSATQLNRLLQTASEALRNKQFQPAAKAVNEILRANPRHGEANHIAGWLCLAIGERDRALQHAKRATQADPRSAKNFGLLGMAYTALDKFEEAAASHKHAVSLDPKFLPSLLNLVPALFHLERYEESLTAIDRAQQIDPALPDVHLNRGLVHVQMCRSDEAVESIERAVGLNPKMLIAHESLCYASNYADSLSPERVFEIHRRAGKQIEAQTQPLPPPGNDPAPDRPIRIGFLTADFRRHSVAFFAENILEHLDRDRVVPTVLSLQLRRDEVAERLKSKSAEWHDCGKLQNHALAARVRELNIDVLFELGGYTSGNRTAVMAACPAPLSVNYLGYPHSTGMGRVTHRFVDAATDPEGGSLATETLVRLPECFLCYRPPDEAPDVAMPDPSRPVVFGSFNDYKKVSLTTVRLWSRVLHAVPGSRLLLKSRSFASDTVRAHAIKAFGECGIGEDRLDIHVRIENPAGHLGLYEGIDIGLEPVPYHGTTTTCEAMWMGVPVVTLRGDRHAMRVGASLLAAVGLQELIAEDEDGYVACCTALAEDVDRRRDLRAGMRDRLRSSPLLDGPGFARRFESAVRDIWVEWCDGRGPGRVNA